MTDDLQRGPVFQVIGRFELRRGREAKWDSVFRERVEAARSAPGWLGVSVWAPLGNLSQRIIVGRWRSSEDFEAWTQTDSHIQTKAALDSCQTADPEIERLQSVLIVDSADA